jgi:hypothetical protein
LGADDASDAEGSSRRPLRLGPRAGLSTQVRVANVPAPGSQLATQRALYWSLRVAIAACFLGHGAFGIITRADWLPYFAAVGIPEWLGWRLEPVVGAADISIALLTLVNPRRGVLAWAVFWGLLTALMRPLAGQGIWEFLTRAGNVGIPLAMLYLSGWGTNTTMLWWDTASARALEHLNTTRLAWMLRLTTVILLVGHGGLGLVMHKQSWISYFGALGIGPDTVQSASLMPLVGGFEMLLGVGVLVKPARSLLLAVFAWKVGTELLRLPAGELFWEVPEQGVTFAAPLALFFVTQWMIKNRRTIADPAPSVSAELPAPIAAAA